MIFPEDSSDMRNGVMVVLVEEEHSDLASKKNGAVSLPPKERAGIKVVILGDAGDYPIRGNGPSDGGKRRQERLSKRKGGGLTSKFAASSEASQGAQKLTNILVGISLCDETQNLIRNRGAKRKSFCPQNSKGSFRPRRSDICLEATLETGAQPALEERKGMGRTITSNNHLAVSRLKVVKRVE